MHYDKEHWHKKTHHTLYKIWASMLYRCRAESKYPYNYNPYKEKGITVCEEWVNDYWKFYRWAWDNGWQVGEGKWLDRIDNDGNYCPDNCRWVTSTEQNNNKSNNYYVEYMGVTDTITNHIRKHGLRINYNTARQRYKNGLDVEDVFCEGRLKKRKDAVYNVRKPQYITIGRY